MFPAARARRLHAPLRAASLLASLLLLAASPGALGRPVDRLPRFEILDPGAHPSTRGIRAGAFSGAAAGTVFFGGTFWNADSARWQAIRDSVWTFDSGVGSHFDHSAPHVNPFKDPGLHAYMEGWVGIDNSYQGENPYFRRLTDTDPRWTGAVCVGAGAGLGGSASFWCGVLPEEADALCYADGQGYGNSWKVCIQKPFSYAGGGVTLEFDFVNETEPDFDFSRVVVDTGGTGDVEDEVVVVQYHGAMSGRDSLFLSPGIELPAGGGGSIHLRFCFTSDGAWSDEDGLHATACGAFAVDNVRLSGGIVDGPATFETGDDGWSLSPPRPGPGGEWSHLAHLDDLPPFETSCPCDLRDSVLVFEDLTVGGHNPFKDNLAASPWIDLVAEGVANTPGKILETKIYSNLPLLSYVFTVFSIQYYPEICPVTGNAVESPWTYPPQFYYQFPISCTQPEGRPTQIDFSSLVSSSAERVRLGLGVVSFCRFFANCTGMSNSTPWFDDVRFGVYGTNEVPLLATRSIDLPQDSFPQDGTLDPGSPGRIDCNNVLGATSPESGTSLGDTLVVQGATGGAEVHVQFAVDPGPGVDPVELANLRSRATFAEFRHGLDWYSARMDSAEIGAFGPSVGTWMTTFHEEDPGFTGTDRDLDPDDLDPTGRTVHLANDIFPDDLLTPGSRLMLFYKTRFLGGTTWFVLPDTSGGNYLEMEVLPSSMDADSTFNCTLYVDHFDRGARGFIEEALATVLPGGSSNFESTPWDRWTVRAASSQQASFGRPPHTQYGASLIQALGYRTILWNSGNLNAFCLTREDADVLIPWLTLPGFGSKHLYLSGDGIAHSMYAEASSEPSALRLLEDHAGVFYTCGTFREEDCPPGSPLDMTACVNLDPVSGAQVSTRPLGSTPLGQGNGCPQMRSFDVIRPNPSPRHGTPVAEEEYRGAKTAGYASVSNLPGSGMGVSGGFRTVVDGLSLHERRDPGACTYLADDLPLAVQGRLQEVLDWFGVTGDAAACRDLSAGTGLEDPPAPPEMPTALRNASPNPMRLTRGTRIAFTLADPGQAALEIFDLRGRRVRTLLSGEAPRGVTEIAWDGTDDRGRSVASGVYFYRLSTPDRRFARKIVVVGN